METTQEIIARVMAQRTQAGLKLVISKDGHTQTLYPKDAATLAKWTAGFTRKGFVCASS